MFGKSRFSEGSTAHSAAVLRGIDGNSHLTVKHSGLPMRMQRPLSQRELSQVMNAETLKFLNKHFPQYYEEDIPLNSFVCAILNEYEGLWTPEQALQVESHFVKKLAEMLEATTHIDIVKLTTTTKENGIIGLILSVFRHLKEEEDASSPQSALASNLTDCKNILQEFVEGMYATLERELYGRFNVEMRRMILKHKEADRMIKQLNEMINEHSDVIDFAKHSTSLKKQFEEERLQHTKEVGRLQLALQKEQLENDALSKQVERLTCQNEKLSARLDHFQNRIIEGYRPLEHVSVAPATLNSKQHLANPSSEFASRQPTAARSRGLSFFVSEDKSISLGGRVQATSRSRLSHTNKENIMDAANRPSEKMFL